MLTSSATPDEILTTFRWADAAARQRFVADCPPCAFKDQALIAAGMAMPEMAVQALDFLAAGYAKGGPYSFGAVVAEACHRLAREAYAAHGPGAANSYVLCAGRAAQNWAMCLQRLGRHGELLRVVEPAISWLESVGDKDNLNFLRLYRIEAHIDLQNYDEAMQLLLAEADTPFTPFEQSKHVALAIRLADLIRSAEEFPQDVKDESLEKLGRILAPLTGEIVSSESSQEGGSASSLQPGHLYGVLDSLTEFFGGEAQEPNEFTVTKMIRKATRIFTDPVRGRDPEAIQGSTRLLEAAREWTRRNNFPDHENDALWGLYLCYSRTGREGLAADRLLGLWANVERARAQIADPLQRAGIAARFPYLFPALCTLLFRLGRTRHLLSAIEAAKGRALADVLTSRTGRPVPDAEFRPSVDRFPDLMRRVDAHYVTFFVDETETFAVLVARDGSLHCAAAPVGKEALRSLVPYRDPGLWGRPDPSDPLGGPTVPEDIPDRLEPLVEWLEPLLDGSLLRSDDHLCYSPDEALHVLPLHYATFRGKSLARHFSLSRIHGAHALKWLLAGETQKPERYVCIEVPAKHEQRDEDRQATLREVRGWLEAELTGEAVLGRKADLVALASLPLKLRLVHFATHGTFPVQDQPGREPNPYRGSGLPLAEAGELPDLAKVAGGQASQHLLTPERALDLRLDLSGSHVTLQACVSGLAKEGVGGDALGLEWAFLQLGASSILSTHWDVSARTTARFCVGFYRRWLREGASRGQAWRHTVLEFSDAADHRAHPYHWAAFSLSGDWR